MNVLCHVMRSRGREGISIISQVMFPDKKKEENKNHVSKTVTEVCARCVSGS